MFKAAICLALLAHLGAARFYKPRPLVCPVFQSVQYQDDTLLVKDIQVLHAPFPISQIHLNTVIQTSVVPVTSIVVQEVSALVGQLQLTDVQLVQVTEPLTITRVSTVTRTLLETQLEIFTSTATNYLTDIQTLPVEETFYQTVTDVETRLTHLTKSVSSTVFSTLTVTKGLLQTQVVVESVPVTTVVATHTQVQQREVTNTHNLTKIITQTICPLPEHP